MELDDVFLQLLTNLTLTSKQSLPCFEQLVSPTDDDLVRGFELVYQNDLIFE